MSPRPFGTPFADSVRHYLQQNNLKQSQLTHEIISDIAQRFFDHFQAQQKKKRKAPAGWEAELPIYEAYPRKIARDDALKAIRRAVEDGNATVVGMLQATQGYAQAVSRWPHSYRFKDGRDLCPHPATWFNRGSYQDDPKEWLPPFYQDQSPSAPRSGQGAVSTAEPEGWREKIRTPNPDDPNRLHILAGRAWESIDSYAQKQIAKLCS